ncbi:MAG: superoxide dismutase [Patescibacteria group bacterium]
MPNTIPYKQKEYPDIKNLDGISEKTTSIHYDKLYAGYVAKINEVREGLSEFAKGQKDLVGNQSFSELRSLRTAETFTTNGVYLHEYYFNVLGGDGNVPDNELTTAIIEKWGSVDVFKKYVTESAMAVRGWVVLCWDTQKNRLKVYGGDSHDIGAVWGCLPIFSLDVYEHAYMMDFGADRKAYIEAFWKNMDWHKANELFVKWKTIN